GSGRGDRSRSQLQIRGVAILRPIGLRRAGWDPGVFVLVDGYVAVDQTRLERLGVEGDRLGGDLDGPVDVLPRTALDRELTREGGGQRDVVPAFLRVGRADLGRWVRLAGIVGGDRVPVTEIPVVRARCGAYRDRGVEQLGVQHLFFGIGIEHVEHVHGQPAVGWSSACFQRLHGHRCEVPLGDGDDHRLGGGRAVRFAHRSAVERDVLLRFRFGIDPDDRDQNHLLRVRRWACLRDPYRVIADLIVSPGATRVRIGEAGLAPRAVRDAVIPNARLDRAGYVLDVGDNSARVDGGTVVSRSGTPTLLACRGTTVRIVAAYFDCRDRGSRTFSERFWGRERKCKCRKNGDSQESGEGQAHIRPLLYLMPDRRRSTGRYASLARRQMRIAFQELPCALLN